MRSIMRIKQIFTLALILIFGIAEAQNKFVATGEWFWDTDPGTGNGTPITAVDGNFDDAIEEVMESSSNIPALGVHTFNIRVQDASGSWGPRFTTIVDSWEPVVAQQDANITMAEFFWDTDPGEGNGTPMLASDGAYNEAVEAIMEVSTNIPSSLGSHILYIRSREDEGNWGPAFATVVDVWADVTTARSSFVKSAEYFFDTDPGEGNATPILAQDGNFDQTLEAIIGGDIPAPVAQGVHVLYIRPMDEEDTWGPTFGIVVNIDTTLGAPPFSTVMSGPDEICEHDLTDTFTYTATQNVGTSFEWTVTGGSVTSGAGTNEVEVTWDGVAPYSIKVVECDVTAVCDSVEFGINVLMPVTVNTTAMICPGDSIFLEGAWQTSAGQYIDTYTGANGCDSSIVTTLSINDLLVSFETQTDVSCNGDTDGSFTVSASGGVPPYTYDIGNGPQLSGTFTGLGAGAYTVEVEDSFGCQFDLNVTIVEPTPLIIQCSSSNGNCTNGNLGEACVNASGGTPGYTYLWSNGATTECILALEDGEYCVWVYDNNGCVDSCCVTIQNDPGYIIDQDVEMCDGDSIFLEGAWQFGSDTYTDSYVTSGGCDSVVNTTVSLLDIYFTQETMTIMIGDSAYLENAWQHTAGFYYDTLTAVNGCDSIIETDLMISPVGIIEGSLEVDIYPNPVSPGQMVTAQLSQKLDEARVEVLDMSGRTVFVQSRFNTDRISIQLDVATGVYRLRLIADDQEFGRKLLVR